MKLGDVIRRWRLMAERDLRSVSTEMGISAATLMRVEQGHVPDGRTLVKILAWLFGDGEHE